MERAQVDGSTLEFQVDGNQDGEPVVFIHGALIADTFEGLLREPSLAEACRLVTYHRRGHAGSSHSSGPIGVRQHVADCVALLRKLDIEQAHVVGHSYGGSIALQLALDSPDRVRSLAVLEPALFLGGTAAGYREALARGRQRFGELGPAGSVDEFLLPRFGPGYRSWLDGAAPGGLEQATADAGTWFEQEMPALVDWRFGKAEVRRIRQPVLAVLGSESDALWHRFGETHQLLLEWLPDAESFVLPNATHGLQMQNPRALGERLAAFVGQHPLHSRSGQASADQHRRG